jgi:hypothetical protein
LNGAEDEKNHGDDDGFAAERLRDNHQAK